MPYPLTTAINRRGHLEVGGCDLVDLAYKYGTPLFVVDEETIRAKCQQYVQAFRHLEEDAEIIYASKAFGALAVCQIIREEGLFVDVSTGGELYVALRSGFPPHKIYFHGNNKTEEEIEFGLREEVGTFVVDGLHELDLLNRLSGKWGRRTDILLRITPGIETSTHKYIQTGQIIDNKFGFPLYMEMAMAAVKETLSKSNLKLRGFHTHIGSQLFSVDCFEKAAEIMVGFCAEVQNETGFVTEKLNLGGGLGIKYRSSDRPASIEEFVTTVVKGVRRWSDNFDLPSPGIAIEPGRSIVGNSTVTLYTVGGIKEVPEVRTFVAVDGGMSDNIRPMLYDAVYEARIANKAQHSPQQVVTIAGKHCECGDILIKEVALPPVQVGDIIVVPATGAYGYAMASNYNLQPRPAVVLVNRGQDFVIIERESYQDLLRLHKPLRQ